MDDADDRTDSYLLACLDAAPDERRRRLAELRATDPDQARRVGRLLGLLDEVGFLDDAPRSRPDVAGRIGGYRLLRVLGSGGMGVVFEAERERDGHRVALKVLHDGLARTEQARERFRREALAAARLEHPAFCAVHEVGSDGDVPFLAMALVAGEPLSRLLSRASRDGHAPVVLPGEHAAETGGAIAAVVRFVERAALGLHAAHEASLVHRDVKPGNLMVTPNGEPVLLDFGLARIAEDDLGTLTRSGDQLGTPVYMAPEQVRGAPTSAATDVYALGVVLYECLCLQRPFAGPSREQLFRQILDEEPADPRRQCPAIGRDLWLVLQTALCKEPDRRYATAAAFAEDLRRVRLGEPIAARRPGPWLQLQRFARRHPIASTLGAVLAVAAAGFAALFAERERALRRAEAVEAALRANDDVAHAPVPALAQAVAAYRTLPNVDTRSALYRAAIASRERVRLWHDGAVWFVRFSPDGRLMATCSDDSTARLWSGDGALLAVLAHDDAVHDCAFSPDGTCVATASFDGTAAIWQLDGTRVRDLPHGPRYGWRKPLHEAVRDPANTWVWGVAWSPDGTRLATTGANREIRVWDATGTAIGPPFTAHVDREGMRVWLAWSPDGQRIASCQAPLGGLPLEEDTEAFVFVWRPGAAGHSIDARLEHPDAVASVAFGDDGSVLTTCADGRVRLWPEHGASPLARDAGGWPYRAKFTDGGNILCGDVQGHVHLWTAAGELLATRKLDDAATPYVGARYDGETGVALTSVDMSLRVVDDRLLDVLELRGHREKIWFAAFAPDGTRLASSSFDQSVRVWELHDPELPRLIGHAGAVTGLALGPDGKIVSAADDGTLRVWDLATGLGRVVPTSRGRPWTLAVSPDRRRAALLMVDRDVDVFDLGSGARLAGFARPDDHDPIAATFVADGRLIVGGRASRLHEYSVNGTRLTALGDVRPRRALAVAHAPERRLLAEVGWGGTVFVHGDDGTPRASWTAVGPQHWLHAVAFAPDETELAVGGTGGLVQIWDVRDLARPRERLRLAGHESRVTSLAWSPDGTLLASAGHDGSARLWHTGTGEALAVLRGHRSNTNVVAFSADGRFVLTGGSDGAIQAWPTDIDALAALAERRVARLHAFPRRHDERVVEAAIANGRAFLLDGIATRLLGRADGASEADLALAVRAAQHAVAATDGKVPAFVDRLERARRRLQR